MKKKNLCENACKITQKSTTPSSFTSSLHSRTVLYKNKELSTEVGTFCFEECRNCGARLIIQGILEFIWWDKTQKEQRASIPSRLSQLWILA